MATQLQIRRGTTAQMNAFTGAEGELAVNTTTDTVHVHDGSTAGGFALAKADGSNIGTYAGSFTTLAASGAVTLSSTLAVTGTATMDGLIVDGNDSYTSNIRFTYGSSAPTYFADWGYKSSSDGNKVFLTMTDGGSAKDVLVANYNGNVGIGTSSPSTGYKLHLAGDNTMLRMQHTGSGGNGYLDLNVDSTVATINANYASSAIDFRILTGSTERMRIDSSGNVGIGTSSPSSALHVDASSTSTLVTIHNTNGSSGDCRGLDVETSTTATTVQRWFNAGSELGRFTATGNLLVGTTNSSGNSGQGIKLNKVSSDGVLHIVGATTTIAQDAIQVYSTGASAYRFFVQYNGQVNATFSSINAISDASLKQNIRDLDKGLEAVLALQPRRFDWINGDGNDIMGFVAQEVETVLPELVHDYKYSEEETKLGLKMGDMIPSLVKAIQEQQATIEALTTRLTALENT